MLNCDLFLFFYRILQIDLPSDVRGFPSVGTMYWPMASRVTESVKETCRYIYVLQLNIVTKHCKKWCLLSHPPHTHTHTNDWRRKQMKVVAEGRLTYQKPWQEKKRDFFLVPPCPSSDTYTHCKKSCFLPKICLVYGFRIHVFYDRMIERKRKERKRK